MTANEAILDSLLPEGWLTAIRVGAVATERARLRPLLERCLAEIGRHDGCNHHSLESAAAADSLDADLRRELGKPESGA